MKKMKKLTLLFLVFVLCVYTAHAQSPIIQEFRELIKSGQTNFTGEMGEKTQENPENKIVFYKTKRQRDIAVIQSFIIHQTTENSNIYVIKYSLKDAEPKMLKLLTMLVQQYVEELNLMVKSGGYTGRNYKRDNGTEVFNVTEINDKAGNHILDFESNEDTKNIFLFGLNAKK